MTEQRSINRPAPGCAVCGKAVPVAGRGRPAVYCSRACRSRAYRLRLAGDADVIDRDIRDTPDTDSREGATGPDGADPVDTPPGAEAGSSTGPLSVERIVEVAIELVDADGPAALSMRTVAARLGAGTMSLYRHVSSREALIDLMADAVFAERPLPPPDADPAAGWRERLEFSARAELEIYRRHPWLPHVAALIARPPIGPHLMAYPDWRLRALDGLGLDFAGMTKVSILLSSFVQSIALTFTAPARGGRVPDRREWFAARQPAIEASLRAGDLPMVARFDEQTFRATEPDAVFDFGLRCLLDGVAVLIEATDRR